MSATYYTEEFLSKVQKMEFDEMMVRQQLSPLHEPDICSVFACGRRLTLWEALCGSKCLMHSLPQPPPDVTKMVSY